MQQENVFTEWRHKRHIHWSKPFGAVMEWPKYAFPESLFPSIFTNPTSISPVFSKGKPAWQLLDKESQDSLKQQLSDVKAESPMNLEDAKIRKSLQATFDQTKGSVIIENGAKIEPGVHFVGPCYVGKNAQIRHGAYIREYSWICSDSVVGHCTEVKHSILLPGAKAPHFNYVGDSILGKDVNLGAGVKLSNLRNDATEVYLRIDGTRVASGLRKFGAVLGEGCQLGCNAVTNPGTVLGLDNVVWPNITVTGIHPSNTIHR